MHSPDVNITGNSSIYCLSSSGVELRRQLKVNDIGEFGITYRSEQPRTADFPLRQTSFNQMEFCNNSLMIIVPSKFHFLM